MVNKKYPYNKLSNFILLGGLLSLILLCPIRISANTASEEITSPNLLSPAEIEVMVRNFFSDIPEMISIAQCESRFRQYNDKGEVLRGSNLYIGIFQFDEKIHAKKALDLGMDIYTIEGNLEYAKYLYQQAGLRPWAGCIGKNTNYVITQNLRIGNRHLQVQTLQKILNEIGFFVAKSGAGSLGNETNYFGALTREAVRRFQCEKKIVCHGNESTTGYGQVGPKTRAMLIQEIQK